MFSAAVSSPSRLGSWNTMPKARRTSIGSLTGSWPATLSHPSLGLSTVVSILIVVVLPAPLGPRKPKMTPSGTANEAWSTAVKPLKRLTRSQASMIAAMIFPPSSRRRGGSRQPGSEVRRRREAAELALEKAGEGDRRAVVEKSADYLDADREACVIMPDWHGRCRQPVRGRDAGPRNQITVRQLLAVDVELARPHRRVVLREGDGRHR